MRTPPGLLTLALCLVAGAAPLSATAWPDAAALTDAPIDSLLEWHAQAMGVDRDTPDERCLYQRSRLTIMGLEGTAESWNQAPLRSRSVLEFGPMSMSTTFDGQRGWLLDRNGAARTAEGPELESLLHEALVADGAYLLRHPPVPLRWKKVDADHEGELSLVFTPLLGSPMRIDLDADTLRPTRLRSDSPQGEQIVDILEWSQIDGAAVVTRSRMQIAGQIEIDVELLSAERIASRNDEFFGPEGAMAPPSDVTFADGVDQVPLELLGEGLHLLVEGMIEGTTPAIFLVDTGAGSNVIDRDAAGRLGLPSHGRIKTMGVGGADEAEFVDVTRLDLGEVVILGQSWLSADFRTLARMFEPRPIGVLGYDFLSRLILDVDYPNQRVVLRRPGSFTPPDGAQSVRLRMDSNIPSIEVVIEDVRTWVHVDTGSDSGLDLSGHFVDEHDLLEGRAIRESALHGVGGSARSQRGEIASLRIGDLVLNDVPTGFNRAESGIFANETVSGILGAAVLSPFRCVFDYPQKTFTLIRSSTDD